MHAAASVYRWARWTGTRACKRLEDRSLDVIACSIVFVILYVLYYIIISQSILNTPILPASDLRTHVGDAVVYATLNAVVKYDVFLYV